MPNVCESTLYCVLGFDSRSSRFLLNSPFMIESSEHTRALLRDAGIDACAFRDLLDAEAVTSVPVTDTRALFAQVRELGLGVGVLTSDDRSFTEDFLQVEGITGACMILPLQDDR